MEENQSRVLSFFRRIFLAITDFRIYPYVQREKASAATAYFTLLSVIITIFLSLFVSNQFLGFVSDTLRDYDRVVPHFTLQNGELDVEERIYDLEGDTRVVVDTYITSKEFANSDIGKEVLNSSSFVVINRDMVIYEYDGVLGNFSWKAFSGELDRDTLHSYFKMIEDDWSVKLMIISVTWLTVFIAYYIIKMVNVLFLIFLAWILNIFFGMKLKFGNYYRIVVYALTLPLIVELITILYLGRIPEYVSLIYQLLVYVYIFYALRALKLDIILISAPGSDFKEKVENMIRKLENEIDEKVKKEEEKKEEEKKEEEKKEEDESQPPEKTDSNEEEHKDE